MTKASVVVLVLMAALIGGCGGGDGGDDQAPRSPTEAVVLREDAPLPADGTLPTDGPYVGQWRAEYTIKQLSDVLADNRYAGEFRLELRGDGTYTMSQMLDGETSGRYAAASGNVLVFGDDGGCSKGGFEGSGVYAWDVAGDVLTLTLIRKESGGCTGRSDSLTIPRWSRV